VCANFEQDYKAFCCAGLDNSNGYSCDEDSIVSGAKITRFGNFLFGVDCIYYNAIAPREYPSHRDLLADLRSSWIDQNSERLTNIVKHLSLQSTRKFVIRVGFGYSEAAVDALLNVLVKCCFMRFKPCYFTSTPQFFIIAKFGVGKYTRLSISETIRKVLNDWVVRRGSSVWVVPKKELGEWLRQFGSVVFHNDGKWFEVIGGCESNYYWDDKFGDNPLHQ